MPSKRFAELTAKLPRRHAGLFIQFRTNHIPLQAYLTRIGKAEAATCPTCGAASETVAHFLLICPTYTLHHAVHYRPLGFSGRNLKTLLNSKEAIHPLFNYVNTTGRLCTTFRSLNIPDNYENASNDDSNGGDS
ncbi:hypothetical protein C8Q73DRAFT_748483 [Cubamyces lactineus]|nr:hypothetical protein C8Q73DRAFT_748483 [Cubamyces lactineus]